MTIRIIEGFDFMPSGLTTSERTRIWAAKHYYFYTGAFPVVPNVDTGRFDFGKAWTPGTTFVTNTTSGEAHIIPIGDNNQEGVIGIAVKRSANAGNMSPYINFTNGQFYTDQLTVCFHLAGVVQVRLGGPNGTILITSVTGAFYDDQWFYCEVKAKIAETGGYCQVRINTEIVIDLVDANTQNIPSTPDYDAIAIGWATYDTNEQISFWFDDLYYLDLLGTENNDYLGNVRVKTQFTSGPGNQTEFTIGGSAPALTNWQSVSNKNLNDTKFVYSDVVGEYDLYTVEAILNSPVVYGVQVCGAMRMDDATQRIAKLAIRSNTTEDFGVDHYVNQTYSFYKDIWELNPDTGVGWTGTEVNAIEVGPELEG